MPALGPSCDQGELSPVTRAAAACPLVLNLEEVLCISESFYRNRDIDYTRSWAKLLIPYGPYNLWNTGGGMWFLPGQEAMLPSWKNSEGIVAVWRKA